MGLPRAEAVPSPINQSSPAPASQGVAARPSGVTVEVEPKPGTRRSFTAAEKLPDRPRGSRLHAARRESAIPGINLSTDDERRWTSSRTSGIRGSPWCRPPTFSVSVAPPRTGKLSLSSLLRWLSARRARASSATPNKPSRSRCCKRRARRPAAAGGRCDAPVPRGVPHLNPHVVASRSRRPRTPSPDLQQAARPPRALQQKLQQAARRPDPLLLKRKEAPRSPRARGHKRRRAPR